VSANLASYYPGQPRAWIEKQAAQILAATGWPAAAASILGAGAAPATTGPQGAPAAPAAAPAGPARPAPAPAAPPDAIDRNATVQANAAATAKAAADAKAAAAKQKKAFTAREQRASRMADQLLQGIISSNAVAPPGKKQTFLQAKKQVIAQLQRAMPGHPYKRIIALAGQVMAAFPSAYGK
jgi:hypothetical protein